ncbi:hypothetical protein BKA81DRAFT_357934 [Phyllosticta paracitricarpa]
MSAQAQPNLTQPNLTQPYPTQPYPRARTVGGAGYRCSVRSVSAQSSKKMNCVLGT